MSDIVVQRGRQDAAICVNCGHTAGYHTTAKCAWNYRTLDGTHEAVCDCEGWERDTAWPPPLVVKDSLP